MIIQTIIHGNDGETFELRRSDDGWICPVCGFAELSIEPYDAVGVASFETCPECSTEYGHDDAAMGATTRQSEWKELRFRYLEEKSWLEDHIVRICGNLGIRRTLFDIDARVWKKSRSSDLS